MKFNVIVVKDIDLMDILEFALNEYPVSKEINWTALYQSIENEFDIQFNRDENGSIDYLSHEIMTIHKLVSRGRMIKAELDIRDKNIFKHLRK